MRASDQRSAKPMRRGQSYGPNPTRADQRFERAARLCGGAKTEHWQRMVVGEAIYDEFATEGHGAGARVLVEVDLVWCPLAEALVRPALVEPTRVRAELRLDRVQRSEERDSVDILLFHGCGTAVAGPRVEVKNGSGIENEPNPTVEMRADRPLASQGALLTSGQRWWSLRNAPRCASNRAGPTNRRSRSDRTKPRRVLAARRGSGMPRPPA